MRMRIMITGAGGFMGRNLTEALRERRGEDALELIDAATPREALEAACARADFVFHLAGVNRPPDPEAFMRENGDFTAGVMALLARGKRPPVVLSSSIQAALDNPYGLSKRAAEEAVAAYGRATGAQTFIYRLPNVFGKWSRPNYNSVVATFCHNLARGLPITINDPEAEVPLVYIDDVVEEFLRALGLAPTRDGEGRCAVRPAFRITVGGLAEALRGFGAMRDRLECPDQSDGLTARLYATYLSFLPPEDFARSPVVHADARGSFAELLHLGGHGQVSVNVSRPHIVKGEHWHQTKHEKFVVLSGEGVIRFRKPGDATVISYRVSGDVPQVVDIPPGYTHNLENTGDTDMITLMWANERFDPARPDTIRLPVAKEETP